MPAFPLGECVSHERDERHQPQVRDSPRYRRDIPPTEISQRCRRETAAMPPTETADPARGRGAPPASSRESRLQLCECAAPIHSSAVNRYAEQSLLVYVCDAASRRGWRQRTGCALACEPHSQDEYGTGCSPSSFRSYERPAAAFHYNCQPRGSRGRALVLLARSGYRPGAQAEAQRTRTSMGERSGLLS